MRSPRVMRWLFCVVLVISAGAIDAVGQVCYIDTSCSAGNQRKARNADSGECISVFDCVELWKCAQGPVTGSCGGGSTDCTFSPGCSSDAQDCFFGFCRSSGLCNDRIKHQGYSFSPTINECSCSGNPPAAGGCFNAFTLDLEVVGEGNVNSGLGGLNCGILNVNCSELLGAGAVIDLVATPGPAASFVGWSGDPDCDDGRVTMNSNKACTATFASRLGFPAIAGTLGGDYSPSKPTVVITHGWQPLGLFTGSPPGWVEDLRQEILDRTDQQVNVLAFTWPGAYLPFAPLTPVGLIRASNLADYQGHTLASKIARTIGNDCREDCNLHLIGHSLGTIVNARAASILTARGFHIPQVTLLDPALNGTPYSERFFRQMLPPAPAVEWVDNYIATRPILGVLPIIGEPVSGAALDGGFEVDANHRDIHTSFYEPTIRDAGGRAGFDFSPVLGESGSFLPASNRPSPQRWRPVVARPSVLDYLRAVLADLLLPGWRIVTGTVVEGVLEIAGRPPLEALVLRESSDSAIDMAVEVPEGAAALYFALHFAQPGDGDWLSVSFDGEPLYSFQGDFFDEGEIPLAQAQVPIEHLAGSDGVLELRLNSAGEVNAEFVVGDFQFVELKDNRAPIADAGPNQVLAANGECTASVTLNGSASSDPDDDPLSYRWASGTGEVLSGVTPQTNLPLGAHIFILTVDDGFGGTDSDEIEVRAEDRSSPTLEALRASPDLLWPPNHKMVPVVVSVVASDACDPQPACHIVGVTSNEPISGPGGSSTSPDWEITGPLSLKLRAERSGSGDGRIYSVEVECSDASGNTTRSTTEVVVPHDLGS